MKEGLVITYDKVIENETMLEWKKTEMITKENGAHYRERKWEMLEGKKTEHIIKKLLWKKMGNDRMKENGGSK